VTTKEYALLEFLARNAGRVVAARRLPNTCGMKALTRFELDRSVRERLRRRLFGRKQTARCTRGEAQDTFLA